ncbi:MAG: MFS transporter [Rhodospirillales bacterium]
MIWLRVFLPFALAYYLSYLFRVVNAVIAPELTAELALDAPSLGLLTSAYFATFALVQLPLGVALDRYGPGRVNAGLMVFAALGALAFALAESVSMLVVARGLIGFGVSACLMAAFKAYVVHFPRDSLPRINGLQMGAGGLGALTATVPVEAAMGVVGWRGVFFVLAGLTLLVAVLVFFSVPKGKPTAAGFRQQMMDLPVIFKSPLFWRIAPMTMAAQGGFIAIMGLWSGPWLADVAGLEQSAVASQLFWNAAVMVVGFIGLGFVAERLGRSSLPPFAPVVGGLILFMAFEIPLALLVTEGHPLLWVGFAFFGTTGILAYAKLTQQFPPELAGRLNASINMLVFLTSFAIQWGAGWVIGLFEPTAGGGYAPEGYRAAFLLVLAFQLFGLVWYVIAGLKFRRPN